MLRRLALLLLLSVPAIAWPATYGTIEVDGRSYSIEISTAASFDATGQLLILPSTAMRNCRRASGAQPSGFGNVAIVFGANFETLYTNGDIPIAINGPHWRLTTVDGDVRCDGQEQTQVVFSNGFE